MKGDVLEIGPPMKIGWCALNYSATRSRRSAMSTPLQVRFQSMEV